MRQTILLMACSSFTAIGATILYMSDGKPKQVLHVPEKLIVGDSSTPFKTRIETLPKEPRNQDTLIIPVVKKSNLYEQAVDEMEDMLEGRKPLSFKRAVFLYENAYFDGKLNWENFCKEIDDIKVKLESMIVTNKMSHYKTAGHWAIFKYMTDTIPENNFKPYGYDLENLINDRDYESFTVASLMKNKLGNCHSLPYMYKILADEMKAEAFITLAPLHIFIKHKDEQDQWWNLELTSGTFSRTSFIIESFKVTDAGMESGLYMKPLSPMESIALCLNDLLYCYDEYKGIYSGALVKRAYTIGLKHYPNSLLQISKVEDQKYELDQAMKGKGLRDYKKINKYPELVKLQNTINETKAYIRKIGMVNMSSDEYRNKVLEIKELQTAQAKK